MATKTHEILLKAAQALCVLLGAPPFAPRAPAVVLLTRDRSAGDRAAVYRQRYSRYLAAMRGDDCC